MKTIQFIPKTSALKSLSVAAGAGAAAIFAKNALTNYFPQVQSFLAGTTGKVTEVALAGYLYTLCKQNKGMLSEAGAAFSAVWIALGLRTLLNQMGTQLPAASGANGLGNLISVARNISVDRSNGLNMRLLGPARSLGAMQIPGTGAFAAQPGFSFKNKAVAA